MSSKAAISSITRHQHNSSSAAKSPKAAGNGIGLASIGGGYAPQYNRGENVLAAQLCAPPAAREYSNASFGPIIAGHYTEF